MNLEEFGPDAKDEMSPADYIQYCLDQYYEYRTLAMDPTINDQATKLYLEKASEYYARAQDAMDEIEPDNTDHLSDEDKALPNVPLDEKDEELSDRDKAMVDDYEEEEANREVPRNYDSMYENENKINKIENINLNRWAKLAGISENEESGNDKWSSEDGREIKWLNPINPNETLYDVEEDETITKGEYYNDNVLGRDSDETQPNYGTKTNGKWNFSWDSGEIEGFVEGEDFEFV
jgi:hypothetical protein